MAKTCHEIEQALLRGDEIAGIQLTTPEQRRMLGFFLQTGNRETGNFTPDYIEALKDAYAAVCEPQAGLDTAASAQVVSPRVWRLKRIETRNFGGVNRFEGEPFGLDVDGESYCIEGYNGMGKSSLLSAIVWGLTGNRLVSQVGPDIASSSPQPVFDPENRDQKLGAWPPVIAYPMEREKLASEGAEARVKLTFENADGETAEIERHVLADGSSEPADPPGLKALGISDLLVEIAVEMPNRIPFIRVGESQDEVSALVKLLGLEPLGELGDHVAAVCHGNKNFMKSPSEREVAAAKTAFDQAVEKAAKSLEGLSGSPDVVNDLGKADIREKERVASELADKLTARSAELLERIKAEISEDLDIQKAEDQRKLTNAIHVLETSLDASGLPNIPEAQFLDDLQTACGPGTRDTVHGELKYVEDEFSKALEVRTRKLSDKRLQLKATAADWHKSEHGEAVDVTDCPLCDRALDTPQLNALGKEIQKLKNEAELVRKTFKETCDALVHRIHDAVPTNLQNRERENPSDSPPVGWFLQALANWLKDERNLTVALPAARDRAMEAILAAETQFTACGPIPDSVLSKFEAAFDDDEEREAAKRLKDECDWAQALTHWSAWWEGVRLDFLTRWTDVLGQADELGNYGGGTLHDTRLSVAKAVDEATPFADAAGHLKDAAEKAKQWRHLRDEHETRKAIRKAIEPLKDLRDHVSEEARNTLASVSERTGEIFDEIYQRSPFVFDQARADKKDKLFVTGKFHNGFVLDAAWVANTSWLRCFLWSFLFALREKTIEELGHNSFPLLVLDDPQTTFDHTNAKRWAEKFAEMSKERNPTKPGAQLVVSSFDDKFLSIMEKDGFQGRRATVVGIDPGTGVLQVVSGSEVVQAWNEFESAQAAGSPAPPQKAQDFINKLRIHVEGMLTIMLHGIGIKPTDTTVGGLLNQFKGNDNAPPFNYQSVRSMVDELEKRRSEFREPLNKAHHDEDRRTLDGRDAENVKKNWDEFRDFLVEAFQAVRRFEAAHPLYVQQRDIPPTVPLPTDFKEILDRVRLKIAGRVAAFTGGRVALMMAGDADVTKLRLPNHAAIRVTTDALMPVASAGDILLLTNIGRPKNGDLVLAAIGDQLRVGRLHHGLSDEARIVLSPVNSSRPDSAPPIIVGESACEAVAIDGVLYSSHSPGDEGLPGGEVARLAGEANLSILQTASTVAYEIDGDSAIPVAEDDQYVLAGAPVTDTEGLQALDGRPVIASLEGGGEEPESYFKRLRWSSPFVIFENIDPTHPTPSFVATPDGQHGGKKFTEVRAVLGVVFKGLVLASDSS